MPKGDVYRFRARYTCNAGSQYLLGQLVAGSGSPLWLVEATVSQVSLTASQQWEVQLAIVNSLAQVIAGAVDSAFVRTKGANQNSPFLQMASPGSNTTLSGIGSSVIPTSFGNIVRDLRREGFNLIGPGWQYIPPIDARDWVPGGAGVVLLTPAPAPVACVLNVNVTFIEDGG